MARSLMRQFSRSHLASKVTELYETHHRTGSEPDTKAITAVLDAVLSDLTGDVYLVFDALDECPEDRDRILVIDLLKDLLKQYSTEIRLHILITSRPAQDIQDGLDQFSKIDLEARLAEDVKTIVTSRLTQPRLKRWILQSMILSLTNC
ncbi:hypothetical protein N7488_012308 [Penicillium malachiteum]|nr:hypothetical protein N7488_012308 [Penicillium malachiteum]